MRTAHAQCTGQLRTPNSTLCPRQNIHYCHNESLPWDHNGASMPMHDRDRHWQISLALGMWLFADLVPFAPYNPCAKVIVLLGGVRGALGLATGTPCPGSSTGTCPSRLPVSGTGSACSARATEHNRACSLSCIAPPLTAPHQATGASVPLACFCLLVGSLLSQHPCHRDLGPYVGFGETACVRPHFDCGSCCALAPISSNNGAEIVV